MSESRPAVPVRRELHQMYVAEFTEGSVHLRNRVTRECVGHMSIFVYETVRGMAVEDAMAVVARGAPMQ